MEIKGAPKFKPDPKSKMMDQVRQVLRYHHYAYRTEQTYCDWILRYIKFHGGKTHPAQMGKTQIDVFLALSIFLPKTIHRSSPGKEPYIERVVPGNYHI
jgi:hypothetical protein